MQRIESVPPKIWIILRTSPESLPPIASLIQTMTGDLGRAVRLISSEWIAEPHAAYDFAEHIAAPPSRGGPIQKLLHYVRFRKFVEQVLAKHAQNGDLLWIASLDTAMALRGSKVLEKFSYILQLHELYDGHQRRLNFIAPVARSALKVVVPEENRAAILQVWLGLNLRPTVLPNKPRMHSRQRNMQSDNPAIQTALNKMRCDRPVILYQGHISADRDLMPLVKAMDDLPEVQLCLMGKDHGIVTDLIGASDNVAYLGYIQPPDHLVITSNAAIGVMSYDPVSLNNVFCAPNKVWEYAGFGIPYIANHCPPLEMYEMKFSSGICTFMDQESLVLAIKKILNEYVVYAEGATKFYDHKDTVKIIGDILHDVYR